MTNILVHAPIPYDGTSFYRSFGPFSHLQKTQDNINIINASAQGFEFTWHTLMNVDVVFLQRPSTSDMLEIIKIAKRLKKPVWIDYDDDYIKIPKTNPRQDLYANNVRQSQIRECMRLADVITVSTDAIGKSIEEEIGKSEKIIRVRNAFDPFLFENGIKTIPPKKVVLWRGGDTHVKDVELYKIPILHCFEAFPEYTWVFYGHKFDWMIEYAIKRGCPQRIVTYDFTDLIQYMNNIMQINPEIMIVPLEDNDFNRAKSNISWIEGTLAGAAVMASDLDEFKMPGCLNFSNEGQFIEVFTDLATVPDKARQAVFLSRKTIPSLANINHTRYEIAVNLKDKYEKRFPIHVDEKPWGDKRFFEYAIINGHTQENVHYAKGHHDVADWLMQKLDPDTMIEFGCGPGPMLERFLTNNVHSIGLEINDYFIDYFQTRNPVFADRILKVNFAMKNLKKLKIDKTDLAISIEVFEHIDMPESWWDEFISLLAQRIKYFYFSSTPDRASVKFDMQWGHVNVRQTEAWIDLFERNGWKLMDKPHKICPWDLLFESTKYTTV